MTAEEYFIDHWKKHKVWNRLAKPQHQKRLKWCAMQCVGKNAIDVGCAAGHSTAYMSFFRPELKWFGTDFATEIIEYAKTTFPKMSFYSLKGIDTLSTLGEFDSVICSEVVEHVSDPKSFVDQLWRITKIKLIITTPAIPVDDPGHLRVFNYKSLKEIFDFDAIFNIVKNSRYWLLTAERRA